jgi:hypothetical protein
VSQFTEDNVQRIIIDPFYAITVDSQLTEEHEPHIGEAEWVRANASLMGEMGAERWFRQLLDVLEGNPTLQAGPSIHVRLSTSIRCSPPNIPLKKSGTC